MPKRRRPKLRFLDQLKLSGLNPSTSLVVYDRKLSSCAPGFRSWLKSFPNQVAVVAGENLKSLEKFSEFSMRIHRDFGDRINRSWTVIAVGGGSVGDFAGFFASVYKRGLRLVHVPSTWLAAIDSSHGGKTALNLAGSKNQIGTFYESSETWIVRSLLESQKTAGDRKRVDDAMGELAKIALIDGGPWALKLKRPRDTQKWLYSKLKRAISAKNAIVDRDPFESNGIRSILNLGHTWGHVLEVAMPLSHGIAVGQGLYFALDLCRELKRAKPRELDAIESWLLKLGISRLQLKIPAAKAKSLLLKDKKIRRVEEITVLLPLQFGNIERTSVSIDTVMRVARVKGWVR